MRPEISGAFRSLWHGLLMWWHGLTTAHRLFTWGGRTACWECNYGLPGGWYFVSPGRWQNYPPTELERGAARSVP